MDNKEIKKTIEVYEEIIGDINNSIADTFTWKNEEEAKNHRFRLYGRRDVYEELIYHLKGASKWSN